MVDFSVTTVIDTLKGCFSGAKKPLVLHEPSFSGHEWQYVKECIDTGWVSSAGKFVDRFENDLADFTGSRHAVATVNGTAALHISFLLADIQPGDEVLVPSLTFVATCNAIHYCQATPHFVDVDEIGLGVSPEKLVAYLQDIVVIKNKISINRLTNKPIRALCVMHTFGHPVDLDPILEICQQYHLTLIEDAAEALGSYYKGKHVGSFGVAGALSFNGNKLITTGGGGAVLIDNADLAKKAKHLVTTAKLPHRWLYQHDRIAYNYRMPNINAALGCAQLEMLPIFLRVKRQIMKQYQESFSSVKGISFIEEPSYAHSNYWLNAIKLDEEYKDFRDEILEEAYRQEFHLRPAWDLMHTLPMYAESPKMSLSVSVGLQKRLINIPSSVDLMKY